MSRRGNNLIRKYFPSAYVLIYGARDLLFKRDPYLREVGWIRSLVENAPVSGSGEPLPWMNYAVTDLLEERLSGDLNLFEYGSGYSTHFFAKRVRSVISVEYDSKWFEQIKAGAPENLTILFRKEDVDGFYCRSIHDCDGDFDIVVVDGRDRVNCVRQAIGKLSDRGVIILDDSERDHYASVLRFVKERGFRVLSLRGLKPLSGRTYQTSIIYREGNCLAI